MIQMADTNLLVCRLCVEIVPYSALFDTVNNVLSELQCILPNLDYTLTPDPIICNKCTETLHKSVLFKTSCLDTEKYLKNLRTHNIPVDQFFNKTCTNNLVKQERGKGEKCRLCLDRIEDESYTQLTTLEYVLRKYLPEVDLTLVKNTFICSICIDALQSYVNFIKACLDVEDRIQHCFNTKETKFSKDSLQDVLASSIKTEISEDDNFNSTCNGLGRVKIELMDDDFEAAHKTNIKQEEIFIKHEIEDNSELFQDGTDYGKTNGIEVKNSALHNNLPHRLDHSYMKITYPMSDSFKVLLHRYRDCNKGYAHRSKFMTRKIKGVKRSIRRLEKKVKFYQKLVEAKFKRLEAVTRILENLRKEHLLTDDVFNELIACSKVVRGAV